ncbi:MAG: toll/interleukin-1 receptor domain-containing protein [Chloroflexota bacterium]
MSEERPRLVIRDLGDRVDIGGVILPKRTFEPPTAPPVEEARRGAPGQRQRLKVFLSHASEDNVAIRQIYERLCSDRIDAWLDDENLLPGERWRDAISKALAESHAVLACFSRRAVTKEGYLQKELRDALELAKEKPEGTIFLIPAKLEECEIPTTFHEWQWVNLYEEQGYERLLKSLQRRALQLGLAQPGAS